MQVSGGWIWGWGGGGRGVCAGVEGGGVLSYHDNGYGIADRCRPGGNRGGVRSFLIRIRHTGDWTACDAGSYARGGVDVQVGCGRVGVAWAHVVRHVSKAVHVGCSLAHHCVARA